MKSATLFVLLFSFAAASSSTAVSEFPADVAPSGSTVPLDVTDLVRLAERGVGERVIRLLVQQSGLSRPLGVDDVLALAAAGLSDTLLADLVSSKLGSRGTAPEVSYTHEDGVLVVRAKGEPDPPEVASGAPARQDGTPAAPPPAAPAPTVVVVQAAPAAATPTYSAPDAESGLAGFPVGAAFGPTGGVVFLPHTFVGAPAHLGTTVVASSPAVLTPFWPTIPVLAPTPAMGPAWDGVPGPPYGTIGIRTSRGVIQIPR